MKQQFRLLWHVIFNRVTTVLLMIIMLVVMPSWAIAIPSGAGALTGTVTVGKTETTCAKGQFGKPSGSGIGLPFDGKPDNTAQWRLSASIAVAGAGFGPAIDQGALVACGLLAGTLPQTGPACGANRGINGKGEITMFGGMVLQLVDLGWKASMGGTLLVGGTYQRADGGKQAKYGQLEGLLQMQGGLGCMEPWKAKKFTAAGVLFLLTTGPEPAPLDGAKYGGDKSKISIEDA